ATLKGGRRDTASSLHTQPELHPQTLQELRGSPTSAPSTAPEIAPSDLPTSPDVPQGRAKV
ncbi:hypothetical protein P7K49_003439, partial [Saguinus oedipus]